MARIAGVELPKEKRVEVGLTYIFGIGRSSSVKLLTEAKVDPGTRVKNLTEDEIGRLRQAIDGSRRVEGDLKQEISENISRLKEIGSYRGARHKQKLPARGQRTRTNARSKRGKRMTVGSGRKAGKSEGRI